MPSNPDELRERYQAWVDAVIEGGAAYIIGDGEHNRVFEDPDEDRDLNLMFSSLQDAQGRADPGGVIDPIALDDLVTILDSADGRGERASPSLTV